KRHGLKTAVRTERRRVAARGISICGMGFKCMLWGKPVINGVVHECGDPPTETLRGVKRRGRAGRSVPQGRREKAQPFKVAGQSACDQSRIRPAQLDGGTTGNGD